MFSTTWKSTDGTLSPYKYVLGKVIVYRAVYHAALLAVVTFFLSAIFRIWVRFPSPAPDLIDGFIAHNPHRFSN
ncbi:MAG: hypothetical protein WA621_05655, partial [Candidatus Acidiferrum sp.]